MSTDNERNADVGAETSEKDEREMLYDNTDYDHRRFEPVWDNEEGYPDGEIPPEIVEYLGENPESSHVQMAGPSRTIFHLCGRPDVVQMIDDPAYVIEDEIVVIPIGCFPSSFLLSRYQDEGIFPWDHIPGLPVGAVRKSSIPASVTTSVTTQELKSLYPLSRSGTSDERIKVLRLTNIKNRETFASQVIAQFSDGLLARKDLLFRGLSLNALERSLSFFVPVIRSTNADNEFGPGIYATEDLKTAKDYAGVTGAIMVFTKPDTQDMNYWQPTDDEWKHLTAKWLGLSLSDIRVPEAYHTADIIEGPMSTDQAKAQKKSRFARPDTINQTAFVSYHGCQLLRRELKAIIFLE
ncbi:hypothetical protein BDV28DRAFT_145558 [Aspergillus coremiiformis]|uniref:Uncharacterized protein n=1 Tax=Aspergillus coremiiformis TaxID=138285 RepID=A0A5N6ZF93_9EURO|nr:hypothetical protein BDV28DRAFT_145558 [Aspergillus coremiiformis]